MMRNLKFDEIDIEKYSFCVENSAQRKYSATFPYLKATGAENWEILVKGDYEAVMPVPFVKKLGLKVVVNPVLCQQLGIFSSEDSVQLNDEFLSFFLRKYRIAYYPFNDANTFSSDLEIRNNFVIKKNPYPDVRKNYSPKRRRKLVINEQHKSKLKIKKITWNDGVDFMKNHVPGLHNEALHTEYFRILEELDRRKQLEHEAFLFEDEIINIVTVFKDDRTAVLLGTFNNREKIKLNGASILVDRAIERHVDLRDFDFEGSDVPAIAEFFRGFRAEILPYPVIRNSKKELIKSMLTNFS